LCEDHEVVCHECGVSFCSRCDHACRRQAQVA
jgi:hypothetical protein